MNLSERIDRYIDGLLVGEEKRSFEKEMKADPDLQKQVEERRLIHTMLSRKYHYPTTPLGTEREDLGINDTQELEIDDDLFHFHFNYKNDETDPEPITKMMKDADRPLSKRHTPLNRFLTIAATFAFLTIIFTGLFKIIHLHRINKFQQKLFTAWFQPDLDPEFQQLLDMQKEGIFGRRYSEDTYDRIEDYELFRSGTFSQSELMFYGIIWMKRKQYDEAMDIFAKIITGKEGQYSRMAKWYYALAAIRTGNIDKAEEVLFSLCWIKGNYSSPACKILDELKKSDR